ncbi:hypothetical protein PGT21_005189 [Puccinia graminis f. sp. tritici]|uniref:Uncharacterized protein n=2 Tax=Puccinia graminis f. sp. tritici TaxID=56615 RepID=E3KFW6_PUCGT|nr:uncharacterized protein PGTG_09204 [Puccinia graminis f. sp. tritici CRL 75-36-700-3]KAA1086401.1 hypothetical protein PGTUg99_000380 [Puccinia graminis f. sp. tritici]EFP83251.1 hypothetical protein PGTG_09204 [Puccinia graminis f. sp. tritici CRL 75-36-700-3]KAA1089052.1 hypothetical protein PGT21_005189 [Puccinia graminis f. sp. tritici]KAA1091712.1 hypothetical protein PGTUg99_011607 [Puccinia graminis f. sp. tritici]KAA1132196.1 hypothetical protein PGTUg99_002699 [Puccinia graminis f.
MARIWVFWGGLWLVCGLILASPNMGRQAGEMEVECARCKDTAFSSFNPGACNEPLVCSQHRVATGGRCTFWEEERFRIRCTHCAYTTYEHPNLPLHQHSVRCTRSCPSHGTPAR